MRECSADRKLLDHKKAEARAQLEQQGFLSSDSNQLPASAFLFHHSTEPARHRWIDRGHIPFQLLLLLWAYCHHWTHSPFRRACPGYIHFVPMINLRNRRQGCDETARFVAPIHSCGWNALLIDILTAARSNSSSILGECGDGASSCVSYGNSLLILNRRHCVIHRFETVFLLIAINVVFITRKKIVGIRLD